MALPSTAPSSSAASTASATGSSTGTIEGTWTVDSSIGSFADFSSSFVGYRVQEQLATIGANIAVDRTPDVSGTLTIQGSASLTAPVELGTLPVEGETIHLEATGSLTLHGVTRTVTIPLDALLSGEVIAVTGSLPIAFTDYDIQKPTSFLVLSVADGGTMELQLHFTHA